MFLWLSDILLYIGTQHLFHPFICWRAIGCQCCYERWGYIYLFTLVFQISVFILSEYIPSSRIAGSYIFWFLRKLYTVCHGGWTNLQSHQKCTRLPRWLSDKEYIGQAGDTSWIPGSGRSPGGGNGNPLQDSCLGNPMDRRAWQLQSIGLPKSWAQHRD